MLKSCMEAKNNCDQVTYTDEAVLPLLQTFCETVYMMPVVVLSMSVWIPDRGGRQMACFMLSRRLRLTRLRPESTALLCPIRQSQVLEMLLYYDFFSSYILKKKTRL